MLQGEETLRDNPTWVYQTDQTKTITMKEKTSFTTYIIPPCSPEIGPTHVTVDGERTELKSLTNKTSMIDV